MPYLAHHGVKGQKWGERRWQNYDGSLTPAGRVHYGYGSGKSKNGLSKLENASNKKVSDISSYSKSGQKIVNEHNGDLISFIMLNAMNTAVSTVIGSVQRSISSSKLNEKAKNFENLDYKPYVEKPDVKIAKRYKTPESVGIHKLAEPETHQQTLKNVNPSRKTLNLVKRHAAMNNCTLTSLTSELRNRGYDVTAARTHTGKSPVLEGAKMFKDIKFEHSDYSSFSKNADEAKKILRNMYGDNARGLCSIGWLSTWGGGGHCFSWEIKDGNVIFQDFQNGKEGKAVEKYWSKMDYNRGVTLARLDNLNVNWYGTEGIVEGVSISEEDKKNA